MRDFVVFYVGCDTILRSAERILFQLAVHFLMWSTIIDPWSIFFANEAKIRGHATRVATWDLRLEGGNHMIGLIRGSSKFSPVYLFRRHSILLREACSNIVVLVHARVRGDQILSLSIAGRIL